jgi:FtsH-binding integral membrane protein
MAVEPKYMTDAQARAASLDQGLRSYMLGVYNYMATALAVTGLFALGLSMLAVTDGQINSLGAMVYLSPLKWVIMLAPLGMLFWVYAALMGMSLSSIFLVYTGESITRVFFITAASFGGLSLFGYTTKKNLSGMGSFLMMGLIGIIIAMVVNIFLASSALQFAISVIGVLVFAGLTAYDTQQIKEMYVEGEDSATMTKKSIMGALRLYLDFINLFIMLLSLFGNRE